MATVIVEKTLIKDDSQCWDWDREYRNYMKARFNLTDNQYYAFWQLEEERCCLQPACGTYRCAECEADPCEYEEIIKTMEDLGISEEMHTEILRVAEEYCRANPCPEPIYETIMEAEEIIDDFEPPF